MKTMIPLAAAGLALAASVAFAQPQGTPAAPAPRDRDQPRTAGTRNLKVLPADISHERLMGVMRQWAQALGVQCSHCHVSGNFASDDNPNKDRARGMVRMTMRINGELLPPIVGRDQPRVTCFTCHRGAAEPAVDLPAGAPPRT